MIEIGAHHHRLMSDEPADTIFLNNRHSHLSGLANAVVGNGAALPFPTATFSRVYASFLFCSLKTPREVALEINRILIKEGVFVSVEHERSISCIGVAMQRFVNITYMKPMGKCSLISQSKPLILQAGFEMIEELEYPDIFHPIAARLFRKSS